MTCTSIVVAESHSVHQLRGPPKGGLSHGPPSDSPGIFTHLLRKKTPDLDWLEPWMQLDSMADLMDLPREWIVCPACAEFFWRFPPHGFNPCPFAVGMVESAGLKLDAERMTAVRAGVHLEEMSKAVRKHIDEFGLPEEVEDDDDE